MTSSETFDAIQSGIFQFNVALLYVCLI